MSSEEERAKTSKYRGSKGQRPVNIGGARGKDQ